MLGLEPLPTLPMIGYSIAFAVLSLASLLVIGIWRSSGEWLISAAGVAGATTALACAAQILALSRPELAGVAAILGQAQVACWLLWLAAVAYAQDRSRPGPVMLLGLTLIGLTPAVAPLLALPAESLAVILLRLALALTGLAIAAFLWQAPTPERVVRLLVRLAGVVLGIEVLAAGAGLFMATAEAAGDHGWRGGALAMVAPGLVAVAGGPRNGSRAAITRRHLLAMLGALGILVLIGMAVVGRSGIAAVDRWSALALATIAAVAVLVILLTRPRDTEAPTTTEGARADTPAVGPLASGAADDDGARLARFVDRMTADDAGHGELPDRLLDALLEAVDGESGAIWHRVGPERYRPLVGRGMATAPSVIEEAPGLAADLRLHDGAVAAEDPGIVAGARLWPAWLPPPEPGRLLLPLIHRGNLNGLAVIDRRAPARHPEATSSLRRLGHQAAAYLAEDQQQRTLTEALKFRDLTRRFAFVAHDLKNLKAELFLAAENAQKHRGNQEFYDDLQASIAGSADKLKRVLANLRQEVPPIVDEVDLRELIADFASSRRGRQPTVVPSAGAVRARVDRARLLQAVRHLVDNAFDATGGQGHVSIALEGVGYEARIEVKDDGHGMSQEFITRWLFRPFATTKQDGLGLGLVEARQIVEGLGGKLEAESAVGQGTIMRIILPCIATA